MAHRFHLTSPIHGDIATLIDEEAHHALHVMRFSVGDNLVLFDGNGNEYLGSIQETGKKHIRLRISEKHVLPPSVPRLLIATALPKGDRQKTLIEKTVEIGFDELIPLATQRAVSVPNENVVDRIRKNVVEATKQCERSFLMKIGSPLDVPRLIDGYRGQTGTICLLADPHAETRLSDVELSDVENVVIAVGPEGGFSPAEQEAFSAAQWNSVRMGSTILRVETAAIYAGVILSAKRDQLEIARGDVKSDLGKD